MIGDIGVGIIGFGYATRTFHAPLLRATPGFRLVAVASSRPAAVRAALPDVEVVSGPAELERVAGLDLVVIATPNETHAVLAEAALRAGRRVVVDKPFTITTAEARRLGEVARASERLLAVFQNRRWDSDFLTVREAVRQGLLGRLVAFESRFDRFRPEVRDRWREGSGPGAGLLYDLGPHLLDQALVLFGVPDSVQAAVARQRAGARTDDYFHLVLRYGEWLVVTLQAGSLVSGGSARFTLHGDRASLVKRRSDLQEDQLRNGMVPGTPGWGTDPDDGVLYDGATGETRAFPTLPGDQRGFYTSLRDALLGRAPNPVPPEQGATVIALIEAARRSEAEGRRVVPELRDEERAAWSRPASGGAARSEAGQPSHGAR
ncbi:MAG TPA: oxidoreductase [Gemmatimonadales bacterium]|nr:oxidoreductase [Gemmatimonadales bacterium]